MPEHPHRQNATLPAAFVPPLLAAGLAIYGIYTFRADLDSPRPKASLPMELPKPIPPDGFETEFARLWQDPLVMPPPSAQGDSSSELGIGVSARPFADLSVTLRSPSEGDSTANIAHQIKARVVDQFTGKVLFMPVLVPGEPYGDTREQRRRMRYALLSALDDSGFALSYPDRMTYAKLPIRVRTGPDRWANAPDLVVPIKLYRKGPTAQSTACAEPVPSPDPDYEAVFVLWINESQLGDWPLSAITQILNQLLGDVEDRSKIDVAIIGPSSSNGLLQMAREHAVQNEIGDADKPRYPALLASRPYREVALYSPRATVSYRALRKLRSTEGSNGNGRNAPDCACARLCRFLTLDRQNGSSLRVVPTIGDDWSLLSLIRHELKLRRAWPEKRDAREHIVLITERDTIYGRAFRTTFETLWRPESNNGTPGSTDGNKLGIVTNFGYVRGIDGLYPNSAKLEERPDAEPNDKRQYELPYGTAQLDYLRRLEQYMLGLDQRLRASDRKGITAIGIGGTDVFDKLLILRALRPHFPSVTFFTTDLDARFAQDEELKFTSNLLIASHYGLELNRDTCRGTVPPFRESYQTAMYFSVLMAVRNSSVRDALACSPAYGDPWGIKAKAENETPECPESQAGDREYLQPLMFAIGRNGPYQLTLRTGLGESSKRLQPASPRDAPRWAFYGHLGFSVLGTVLLVGMLWMAKNRLWPAPQGMSDELRPVCVSGAARLQTLSGYLPCALCPVLVVSTSRRCWR